MMTLAEGVYAHLSAWGDLTAIVGDRIYPGYLPVGTELPALTYARVSIQDRHRTHSGDSRICWSRVQLTAHADTDVEVQRLAHLLLDLGSNDHLGDWGDVPVANVQISNQVDAGVVDDQIRVHQVSTDLVITHRD